MKLYLISYPPGYSGDFLAYQVHKDSKFYDVKNIRNKDNRYLFPNFTKFFESKMTYKVENFLLKNELDYLRETYNKNLCINTHLDKPVAGPYTKKIRIYSTNSLTKNIAYAMWWIKSHLNNTLPYDELDSFLRNDNILPEHFKKEYSSWKIYSYIKFNSLNPTIEEYVTNMFNRHTDISSKKINGYYNLNIESWLYNKHIKTTNISRIFNVSIDNTEFERYRDNNYELLEKISVDVRSKNFLNQLTKYIKANLADPIDLYSYWSNQ